MKFDFLKRLALTLAGVGLAVTIVVGTFTFAKDAVPIVPSNDIPFDPFGRPTAPKLVPTAAPPRETPANDSQPAGGSAFSKTPVAAPFGGQFVPPTTSRLPLVDSSASSRRLNPVTTAAGPVDPSGVANSLVKAVRPISMPNVESPDAQSDAAKSQLDPTPLISIEPLPAITRSTNGPLNSGQATAPSSRIPTMASLPSTAPIRNANVTGPSNSSQQTVTAAPARSQSQFKSPTPFIVAAPASPKPALDVVQVGTQLNPVVTSVTNDAMPTERATQRVSATPNLVRGATQVATGQGREEMASASNQVVVSVPTAKPQIEPYPVQDLVFPSEAISKSSPSSRELMGQFAPNQTLRTAASSDQVPLSPATGLAAQTVEFDTDQSSRTAFAATIPTDMLAASTGPQLNAAGGSSRRAAELPNAELGPSSQRRQETSASSLTASQTSEVANPGRTSNPVGRPLGVAQQRRVVPANPRTQFVDHQQPLLGRLPRSLPGLPISGQIPPLYQEGDLRLDDDIILPETEIILEGEIDPLTSGMPYVNDCCRGCPDRTYVVAEGLLFRREGERTQLSSGFKLDGFDYKEGARVTVGRRTDCLNGWEATYMGIEPWYVYESASSPGGNLQPAFFAGPGFTAANIGTFYNSNYNEQFYRSELHSLELNRTSWGWDILTTSYGIRYIVLNEDMRFTALKGADRADLNVEANNHLIGGQIGSELFYDIGRRFYVSTKVRGGLYANINDGAVNYFNTGPTQSFFVNTDQNVALAAEGEIQMNLFLKLTPRARLRAGYEFWYMWGVATAKGNTSRQVGPTSGLNIDDQNDVFMHGLSVGFEFVR